ncbi:hypothetical protein JKA73_04680 [Myxococcus xanthus]|nr:hypothetical protein JKA73_04680 [Myxococcus xanthus]
MRRCAWAMSPVCRRRRMRGRTLEQPMRGRTPEPMRGRTPEPMRGRTPEPMRSRTPEPMRARTPEPMRGRTLEQPMRGRTPEPMRGRTPEPMRAPSARFPTSRAAAIATRCRWRRWPGARLRGSCSSGGGRVATERV